MTRNCAALFFALLCPAKQFVSDIASQCQEVFYLGKKKGFDLTLNGGGAGEAEPSGIPDNQQKGNSLVDFSQSTSSLSSRRKKSNSLSIEWATTASSIEPITLPPPSPSGSMPNDGAAAAFTAITVEGDNKGSSGQEVSSCQSPSQEQVPSMVGTAVSARGKLSEPV